MTTVYTYAYLPCQFCVGKNHCSQCASDIADLLKAQPGVLDAQVSKPDQSVTLVHDGADLDEIVDSLDAMGVFLS